MAYVSKGLMAKARTSVKEHFPSKYGWKITCKRSPGHSKLTATIRKAPEKFQKELKSICIDKKNTKIYSSLNRMNVTNNTYLKSIYEELETCLKTDKYYDNSEVQVDYFDCSHFINIQIGEYDKPFILGV